MLLEGKSVERGVRARSDIREVEVGEYLEALLLRIADQIFVSFGAADDLLPLESVGDKLQRELEDTRVMVFTI